MESAIGTPMTAARSRSAATARRHSSSLQAMRCQSAAPRPMRINGPVTNAARPSLAARSKASTISCRLKRVGTKTNSAARPRAASRSMAAIAEAKLDPGRTRSCVFAVAPSTEIWMHWTPRAESRSAAAPLIWLPSVSILSAMPAAERISRRSQACGTPSGSPPPKATYGMPKSAILRARSSASSRRSSSPHALSGPEFSQHATQRAPQRLVSCQARNKGARYSSTERPCIAEFLGVSGETDVRLGHHLLGNILELRRFPCQLFCGLRFFRPELVDGLCGFDRHFQFAHACLRELTLARRAAAATYWPGRGAMHLRPRLALHFELYHSSMRCGSPPRPRRACRGADRRRSPAAQRRPSPSRSAARGASREGFRGWRAKRPPCRMERSKARARRRERASGAAEDDGTRGTFPRRTPACPRALLRCRCASAGRY